MATYKPATKENKEHESFEVDGVRFRYSTYSVTGAFIQPATEGGPIRSGLPVRIQHHDRDILVLEVGQAFSLDLG